MWLFVRRIRCHCARIWLFKCILFGSKIAVVGKCDFFEERRQNWGKLKSKVVGMKEANLHRLFFLQEIKPWDEFWKLLRNQPLIRVRKSAPTSFQTPSHDFFARHLEVRIKRTLFLAWWSLNNISLGSSAHTRRLLSSNSTKAELQCPLAYNYAVHCTSWNRYLCPGLTPFGLLLPRLRRRGLQ